MFHGIHLDLTADFFPLDFLSRLSAANTSSCGTRLVHDVRIQGEVLHSARLNDPSKANASSLNMKQRIISSSFSLQSSPALFCKTVGLDLLAETTTQPELEIFASVGICPLPASTESLFPSRRNAPSSGDAQSEVCTISSSLNCALESNLMQEY